MSDRLWDAYAFDKHYLDDKDCENGDCQFHADPISLDELDADMPSWNQRQYFLAIFALQIRRVHEELRTVLEWVEANIRSYVRPYHKFLNAFVIANASENREISTCPPCHPTAKRRRKA